MAVVIGVWGSVQYQFSQATVFERQLLQLRLSRGKQAHQLVLPPIKLREPLHLALARSLGVVAILPAPGQSHTGEHQQQEHGRG
jgi:hypothetical protein